MADKDLLDKWWRKYSHKYIGYWVAVKDGKRIAKARTLKKLLRKIDSIKGVTLCNAVKESKWLRKKI